MSQMTLVNESHIEVDDRGRAWIRGTGFKVLDVVQEHLGWGMSAEAIQRGHPGLSLANVYAALTYYHDHKPELDAEIARDLRRFDEERAAAGISPLGQKWRERQQS